MPVINDGPVSSLFAPVALRGNASLPGLRKAGVSGHMADRAPFAPSGGCVARGVPLKIGRVVVVRDRPVTVNVKGFRAKWLVFAHTSDVRPLEWNADELDGADYPAPAGLTAIYIEKAITTKDGVEKMVPDKVIAWK